ncbi:hypothetical protein Alg130_10821 [Pyrenophora tritici-repentis]|nr:hypothetical protein Alg130_10821 [Pyrenophora tritici-repentis]
MKTFAAILLLATTCLVAAVPQGGKSSPTNRMTLSVMACKCVNC